MKSKNILITGVAGFIGYHFAKKMIEENWNVFGIDNLNNYYEVSLKIDRLSQLGIEKFSDLRTSKSIKYTNFSFQKIDLIDISNIKRIFDENKFDIVCNLAAQAGVRYSLTNPDAYIKSNIIGFINLLECMRKTGHKNLIFASSSSVYGKNTKVPFSEDDNVDHPISLYASTKKSNELFAHNYSHLFDMKTIGLRFFTVYGPWGRPDMAMFLFTDAILNNRKIDVFNNGNLSRDFTYIDDIINGMNNITNNFNSVKENYKIYNIGNGTPVRLMDFIEQIEVYLNMESKKNYMPMQDGDVNLTWANTKKLENDFQYFTSHDINYGIKKFIDWYKEYYSKK